uniref:Bis(5'-nucleosyl)-tetraphosphatase [asymmetrical] n=1 Tax=Monopterus albus TaxID=43700 RepID=A0A3Q3IEY0_MONAL|nr:bis(5'-nucleosyl)-tetraphosphatase [asymmetrical] [Monopterus albus]
MLSSGEKQRAYSNLVTENTLILVNRDMAVRACGFIVFRRLASCIPPQDNTEYLLLQTSYGEHHWTPPKGHVDPGEDDLTTALRETKEEAGLGTEQLQVIDGFVQELHYEVRGRPKEVRYWLAELRDPETAVTLSDEHQDYRWARLEEACTLARYKDLQDTLRAAHRHLQVWQDKQ